MLLFGHDDVLARWAGARLGIADFSPCTAIGVLHAGEIVAAAIYNNYRPPNIEITFATAAPTWATKGLSGRCSATRSYSCAARA